MSRADLPLDLDSVLEGRGASLFRTAVLLHHNRDAAIRGLARAFARTARTHRRSESPETLVQMRMIGDFVRAHRHRPLESEADEADVADHRVRDAAGASSLVDPAQRALADPLAGTSPLQRALLVLGAHHQMSPERSAAALRISARRAISERQQALEFLGIDEISQLGAPLHDVAESYRPPSAEMLRRAAGDQQPIARRRTRVRWAVAAGVIAVSVVALLQGIDSPDGLSEEVQAARFDADYASDYGLVDGRPRPFLDGLKLEQTEVIDYSRVDAIIAAPDVDPDTQLYAVAYCDLPGNAMDVIAIVNAITVKPVPDTGETEMVELSCRDRTADLRSSPLAKPLPRQAEQYTVGMPGVWSGAGELHLALYSEADWSQYPFPAFEAAVAPPAVRAFGEVIDESTPLGNGEDLEWLVDEGADDVELHTIEVDVATSLQISVLTDEPGQLLIALDGVVVTNDGEELITLGEGIPGPWQQADPALRQGFWRGYSASGFHQQLDSSRLTELGVDITDDRVQVSVIPRGFNGQGWKVVVTSDAAQGAGEVDLLAPGHAATLPEFAHGLERVGAYSVPTDGQPHEVPLPVTQVDELTWIGACDLETAPTIRTVALRSPTRYGLIPCASYRNEWAAPLTPDIAGPSISEDAEPPDLLTLTAPVTSEAEILTIGAYREVAFEDFPFGAGDQPSTAQLDLRPVPDEGDLAGLGLVGDGARWEYLDPVTETDLDGQGRASLEVPAEERALVSVSTSGKGRIRVSTAGPDGAPLDGNFRDPSVLGRVASPLMYRDGWWTSWTIEPTRWTFPIPPGSDLRRGGLEVEVQGYDDGSVQLEVLHAVTPEAAPEGASESGSDETLAP
ncbi:MAG: hypothetical protein WA991_06090 [Ornithinimicrobium sp.]